MDPVVNAPMKRQTAYCVWIRDIHGTKQQIDAATGLPYIPVQDKHVVRVNVLGSVIDSSCSDAYGNVVIDDGSAQIRLKVWGDDLHLLQPIQVGNLVLVIGRIAEYNGERYLRPEVVRSIDYDWALLRRLQLVKEYGVPAREEKFVVADEVRPVPEVEPSLNARGIIMETIEKLEEVSEEQLIEACKMAKDKVTTALYDLLKEGEVFSPKKGFYRLV